MLRRRMLHLRSLLLLAGVGTILSLSACIQPDAIGDAWDPDDDSYQSATALGIPSTTPATHGPHTLDLGDREDWLRFTLEADVLYDIFSVEVDGLLVAELYVIEDGLAREVASSYGSSCYGGFYLSYSPPSSGSYYLRVSANEEEAAYTVQYSTCLALQPDEWDPRDDTSRTSTSLPDPTSELQSQEGHTLAAADVGDWYHVYLRSGTAFDVWAELSQGDSIIDLYADPAASAVLTDDDGGAGAGSRIVFVPEREGWYYLRVRMYYNTPTAYTLHWRTASPSSTPDPWDPTDDELAGATQLSAPVSAASLHGEHELGNTDLYDWFSVYLIAGTRYFFESTAGMGDPWADLYRDGRYGLERVGWNDDGGGGLRFRIAYAATESGWYKLRVSHYTGQCRYSLRYGRL